MIGFVINYCSNEKPFIDVLLSQCLEICDNVAVSYGSHLYDGTQEDNTYITEYLSKKYPPVKFIEYKVDIKDDLYKKPGVVNRPTAYWHNLARWKGVEALKNVNWFFFIDADEIPEATRVRKWLSSTTLSKEYAYKFANYWYFKELTNQSTTFEDSILLIHRDHISESSIFRDYERHETAMVVKQNRMVMMDNTPMFHHFSWVRSKDGGLAKKIRTWAHRDDIFHDADVEQIINYIYKDDNVNDIVHGYQYKKTENIFNIEL